MKVVDGAGPVPAPIMIVGEAPGYGEMRQGRPFVGRSGAEQARYLKHHGVPIAQCYQTNVVKEWREDNPDPTAEQIADWTPVLESELEEVRPQIVVAVGRFAAQWFLGSWATMELCHGVPAASERTSAVVIPVYHPAAALRDKVGAIRARCFWDYGEVGRAWGILRRGGQVRVATDEWEGREAYCDVGGAELAERLLHARPEQLAFDTEGTVESPWSLQVSRAAGMGWCLRTSRRDFAEGVKALQYLADHGCRWLIHNAMYDLPMGQAMWLDLTHPRTPIVDTMYAAYLTRVEPQGLKALAWRKCGMRMSEYSDLTAAVNSEQRVEWLMDVAAADLPDPEPRVVVDNAGQSKVTTAWGWRRWAEGVLNSWGEDEELDLKKRWAERRRKVGRKAVAEVIEKVGAWPSATLEDVERGVAVRYACRDTDATWRVAEGMS